ncbi:cadherin-like domain-containing protein, partial [Thermodesulfobacteriota bacterium]
DNGIGAAGGEWLFIDADTLSAAAGIGGVNLSETNDMVITSVPAVFDPSEPYIVTLMTFVEIDEAAAAVLFAPQADITTSLGSNIQLQSGGSIEFQDGDDNGVAVLSTGGVELDNSGAATVLSGISAETGIAFNGTGNVFLGADLNVMGPGGGISSPDSAFVMTGDHVLTTNSGPISLDEVRTNIVGDHVLTISAGIGDVTVDDNVGGVDAELGGFIIESAGNTVFSTSDASVHVGFLNVTVSGQARFDAPVTVGGDVAITAGALDLDAAMTAAGAIIVTNAAGSDEVALGSDYSNYQLEGTDVTFEGPIILMQDVTFEVDGGPVQFDAVSTESAAAHSLTITSNGGNVLLIGPVGQPDVKLGNLRIVSSEHVTTQTEARIFSSGNVIFEAEDDILIQAEVLSEGAQGIDFAAGTDGSGSITVEMQLESAGSGGDIIFLAGDSSGGILMKNSLIADDAVQLTTPAGAIEQEAGQVAGSHGNFNALSGIYSLQAGSPDSFYTGLTTVSAQVTGEGDIRLLNVNAVEDTEVLSLTTRGGEIHFEQQLSHLTITGNVTSGIDLQIPGGHIEILSANGLSVLAEISSLGGTGGSVAIAGGVELDEQNAVLTLGAGNITLKGNEANDILIIDVPLVKSESITITSDGDVVIKALVETDVPGADIEIFADNDGDGHGGVIVEAAGFVNSGRDIRITGSDTISTAAVVSVIIQRDLEENQLQAVGNMTIIKNDSAPAAATIQIDGHIQASGGQGIFIEAAGEIQTSANLNSTSSGVNLESPVVLTGDTEITAVSPVTLPDMRIEDGTLNVIANGRISAPSIISQNSSPDNGISLNSRNGNILLGVVDAGDDSPVTLSAPQGAVADNSTNESYNLRANRLVIDAGTVGVAPGMDALDVVVGRIDIRTSGPAGHIYIHEAAAGGGIIIGGIDIQGTINSGSVVIVTEDGSITIAEDLSGINLGGSGHLLLQAKGLLSNVDVQAPVNLTSGSVSILAGKDITIGASGSITVHESGTIDLEAAAGSITLTDTSHTQAENGNIRLEAYEDIALTGVQTDADASITAETGSIFDEGESADDIISSKLRLQAANGIGQLGEGTTNPLEIRVNELAALAGSQGISLREADGLNVAAVAPVTVNRVQTDTSSTTYGDSTLLAGMRSEASGSIVLSSKTWHIRVQSTIVADGSGNVLIQTEGDASDIFIEKPISSGTGNITILAAGSIFQTATLDEGGTTTITGQMLVFTDGDNSIAEITYTLTQAPTFGILQRDGESLNPGDEFTQDDLNSERIAYIHDGSESDSDTFNFDVRDANGGLVQGGFEIAIDPVNDAPENILPATTDQDRLDTNIGQNLVLAGEHAIQINDPDAGLALITTQLEINPSVAETAVLALTMVDNVTVTGNQSTTLTLTGSVDAVNTALASLIYTITSPTAVFTDILVLSTTDHGSSGKGGSLSDTDQIFIKVNNVPDVISNTGLDIDEGGNAVINNTGLQIADTDNSPNIVVQSRPQYGQLLLGGTVLDIGDGFTQADIDGDQLTYIHDGSDIAADLFTFTVSDSDGGLIGETTFQIRINLVNDLPTLTVPQKLITNLGKNLAVQDIDLVDPDANDSDSTTLSLTITGNGVLAVSNTSALIVTGNNTGSVTLSGDFSDIQAWLASLSQQENLIFSWPDPTPGDTLLTIELMNGINPDDIDTQAVSIKINAVPEVKNVGLTVNGGSQVLLTDRELKYTDADNNAEEIIFMIEALPESGELYFGNAPANIGLSFSQSDLDSTGPETALVYISAAGASSGDEDHFFYSVSDGDGGFVYNQKFTILIQNLPATPLVSQASPVTVNEAAEVSVPGLSVTSDAGLLQISLSLRNNTSGLIKLHPGDAGQILITLSGTATEVNTELAGLIYVAAQEAGAFTDALMITADDESVTAVNTVSITVNDIPVLTVNEPLVLNEGDSAAITPVYLQTTQEEASPPVYTLASVPVNGVLQLDGQILAPNGTFTQADIDTGLFQYVHNGDETTADTFNFTVADGDGGFIDATLFDITITSVNDPPTIQTPANLLANEGATLIIPGLVIADSDAADSGLFFVALSLTEESQAVLHAANMGNAVVAGNYTATLNVSGSLSDINDTLAALEIVIPADAYAGPFNDVLTISAGDLGQSGSSGSQIGTGMVTIQVNSIPEIALNIGATLSQEATVTVTDEMLLVSDNDTSADALLCTLIAVEKGILTLDGNVLGVSDTFTQTDINDGKLSFTHDGSAGATGLFRFTVSDGSGGQISETDFIVILIANHPPVLVTNTGGILVEGGILVLSADMLSANDAEQALAELDFILSDTTNGAVELNGEALAIDESFSQVDVNDGKVRFVHSLMAEAQAGFDFTVSDGAGGELSSVSFLIDIIPVNYKINVGQGPLSIPDLEIQNPGGDPASVTVTLTLSVSDSVATLRMDTFGNVNLSGVNTTQITLNGALADINTALDTLQIFPKPGVTDFSGNIVIVADNGQIWTDTVYFKFNGSPALAINSEMTVSEGGTLILSGDELLVTDPDNTRYEVRYEIDSLPLYGILESMVTGVLAQGDVFTQFDIDNGHIFYTHNGGETANDSFSFTLSDGDGGNGGETFFSIDIAGVNDSPVNTVPLELQVTDEGVSLPIPGVSINDIEAVNNSANNITVTLALAEPDSGRASLNLIEKGDAVITGNNSANVTIAGTVADINLTLATLVYSPNPDAVPNFFMDTLTLSTKDGGNSGDGGERTTESEIDIRVNDIPAISTVIPTAQITTVGGTIDIEATDGILHMAEGAPAISNGGDIRYYGASDVIIGGIDAGSGNVSITAESGTVFNGGSTTTSGDKHIDIIAGSLAITAGIGIGVLGDLDDISNPPDPLETTVAVLAASAGTGGI